MAEVDGPPVVVKLLEGTQGIGVMLAESGRAAGSVVEAFHGLDQNITIQKFIQEAKGADIRALVVGNRVVAAMKRQAEPGEFRSNLHRGGTATRLRLSADDCRIAVSASARARVACVRCGHAGIARRAVSPGGQLLAGSGGNRTGDFDRCRRAAVIAHLEREVIPASSV